MPHLDWGQHVMHGVDVLRLHQPILDRALQRLHHRAVLVLGLACFSAVVVPVDNPPVFVLSVYSLSVYNAANVETCA